MIRMMCVIRLVDWVLTDVFCDRVGVAVKTEDLNSKMFVVVWSYVETSIPKSVRLWKLKKLRKGRRVDQGYCRKNAQRRL